ncbi:probable demethylmenaquinone methyltransferase [Coccomyxa sp. Obi]|nr:probable demethylmenaquinone methyltransferase [Coccomyxa sp. Obi]
MATVIEQLTPTQIFKRQWESYQVVLNQDYLEHKALYGSLQQYLQQKAVNGPLRLLDLGCGDSDYISRLLEKSGGEDLVASYTGVDLSEPAIEISKQNINRVLSNGRAQWHSTDFLSFVKGCEEEYDCILMSFALHHLNANAKAELLVECHRLLKKSNGAFLMVDIVRKPGESLETYHIRSQKDVDTWVAVPLDARACFTDHMLKYDFPETVAFLEESGKAAGFRHVASHCAASKGLAQFIAMEA